MDTYAHAVIGNANSFRGAAKDGKAGLALAGLADVVVVRTGIVGDHGGLVIVVVNLLLIAPGESDTLLVALNVAYDTAKADPHGVPCILATLEDGEARCVGQHVRRIDGHTFRIGEVGFYEKWFACLLLRRCGGRAVHSCVLYGGGAGHWRVVVVPL